MDKPTQFMEWCHSLVEFVLANKGKTFKNWTREQIFLHLAGNCLTGTLFIDKGANNDKVTALVVAKPMNETDVCLEETIGDREACKRIYRRIYDKWHFKRVFSMRRGNFVELKGIHKFCS